MEFKRVFSFWRIDHLPRLVLYFQASLALKHNELAQQLSLLNKNIAQKEHLASTIDAREEKMKTECEELKKVV